MSDGEASSLAALTDSLGLGVCSDAVADAVSVAVSVGVGVGVGVSVCGGLGEGVAVFVGVVEGLGPLVVVDGLGVGLLDLVADAVGVGDVVGPRFSIVTLGREDGLPVR